MLCEPANRARPIILPALFARSGQHRGLPSDNFRTKHSRQFRPPRGRLLPRKINNRPHTTPFKSLHAGNYYFVIISERRKGVVLISGLLSKNCFRGFCGSSKYWKLLITYGILKGAAFRISSCASRGFRGSRGFQRENERPPSQTSLFQHSDYLGDAVAVFRGASNSSSL